MSAESCFRWFKKIINDDKTSTWTGKISKNTPFVDCPFVVFDMELSGLDVKKDFIISIGAIKMSGSTINISKEFYRMIKPSGTLSRENVAIHGITPGELIRKTLIKCSLLSLNLLRILCLLDILLI